MALSDYHAGFEGWQPAKMSGSESPQIPNDQTVRSPYLRTTLPLPLQYTGDTVKQYNTPGLSSFRIAPLPPSGVPAVNAAAASTASVVIAQTPASSSTPDVSITLVMPQEFTVTGSPADATGEFDVAWLPEPPETVLGVPTPDRLNAGLDIVGTGTAPSPTLSVQVTPTQTGDYALFFGVSAASASAAVTGVPTGFSSIDPSLGLSGKTVSGTDQLSVSNTMFTLGINPASCGVLALITTGGATPALVQSSGGSGAFVSPGSATVTMTNPATIGNVLIFVATAAAGSYSVLSSAVYSNLKDNKGHPYPLVASAGTSAGGGFQFTEVYANMWMRRVDVSGIQSFTISTSGKPGDILAGASYKVYEFSGILPSTNLVPRFLNPFQAMEAINLGTVGTGGGITGVLGLANGGTNADLSSTGGTNFVLYQAAAGAPVTVGSFDYDKLPGQLLATTYNNVTLAGLGLVSITGDFNNSGASADFLNTNLGTGSPSGLFRITFYMAVTQVASVSSTLPDITFHWVDPDNNTSQSQTFSPASPTGNTLTTYSLGTISVFHKPGAQFLQFSTSGYASSGTTMKYSVHIRVEQLGFF